MCGCKQGTCPGGCACGCKHTPPTMAEQRIALVSDIGTYMMGASAEVMVGVRSVNSWIETAAAEAAGQWLDAYDAKVAAKALTDAADALMPDARAGRVTQVGHIVDVLRSRAKAVADG